MFIFFNGRAIVPRFNGGPIVPRLLTVNSPLEAELIPGGVLRITDPAGVLFGGLWGATLQIETDPENPQVIAKLKNDALIMY